MLNEDCWIFFFFSLELKKKKKSYKILWYAHLFVKILAKSLKLCLEVYKRIEWNAIDGKWNGNEMN